MAGLAICDTMASVGIFTPDLLIYSFPEMTATDEHMKYPFCLVYTTNLYINSHRKSSKNDPLLWKTTSQITKILKCRVYRIYRPLCICCLVHLEKV
jgi:hypothetical protein